MPLEIVPVILAGGEGRRLRPLTAPARPKPFLKLFGGRSMLQHTLARASGCARPVIICDHQFIDLAQSEALQAGIPPSAIIAEPIQRGTTAAIAAAAFFLEKKNPLMMVMPSDHFIEDRQAFENALLLAAEKVPDHAPLIFGVKPEGPRERYGYIRANASGIIESFIEKPLPALARKLWREPGVYWNTGIFLCRAETFLNLLATHAKDVFTPAWRAVKHGTRAEIVFSPDPAHYAAIPSLAVDRAVMEKLRSGVVLPLESGWHDVGCWDRLLAVKLRSFARNQTALSADESKRTGQRVS